MRNDTLKWEKGVKLFGKEGHDWIAFPASLNHFISGILFFLLLKTLNFSNLNSIIISNSVHIIEEFLENKTTISAEGLITKIFQCKNKLFLGPTDHDSLQNSLGDNLCFFVGTLVGNYIYVNNILKKYITLKNMIIIISLCIISNAILCHIKKRI